MSEEERMMISKEMAIGLSSSFCWSSCAITSVCLFPIVNLMILSCYLQSLFALVNILNLLSC